MENVLIKHAYAIKFDERLMKKIIQKLLKH